MENTINLNSKNYCLNCDDCDLKNYCLTFENSRIYEGVIINLDTYRNI